MAYAQSAPGVSTNSIDTPQNAAIIATGMPSSPSQMCVTQPLRDYEKG
jgi:hypothetical protein